VLRRNEGVRIIVAGREKKSKEVSVGYFLKSSPILAAEIYMFSNDNV
jgi:hypothetical protein